MLELYQPIVNFGVLVVIAAMYLWQTPRTIEKITKVIDANTSVVKDSKEYHNRMEEILRDMMAAIDQLKTKSDNEEIKNILSRIEGKVDSLGK